MRDHDNDQINSPNRACSFFYNHNDRSGASIMGMHNSNNASLVTVVVDGVVTKGYSLGGAIRGVYPGSRILPINQPW